MTDVWILGKAHFFLNGHVNSKNWIHWGRENSHRIVGLPLHSKDAQHALPFPSMIPSDHSSLKMIAAMQQPFQKSATLQCIRSFEKSLISMRILMKRNYNSGKMELLLTLLKVTMPWLVKVLGASHQPQS